MKYLNPNTTKAKRICVVGCSGSGKSTLARHLSTKLNLPIHHIDKISWKAGWVQLSTKELKEELQPVISNEKWILDGTYDYTFDIRLPKTDLLILLETNRFTCLFRVLLRTLFYSRGKTRSDMADGCIEKMDLEFYKYIWKYSKKVLPVVLDSVIKYNLQDKFIRLKSKKEVLEFMNEIGGIYD